ncbi:Uncharacterised protein [Yersinia enterocolitica]|nr:Uncharacterised protein [Yersinia enterocolitica]
MRTLAAFVEHLLMPNEIVAHGDDVMSAMRNHPTQRYNHSQAKLDTHAYILFVFLQG